MSGPASTARGKLETRAPALFGSGAVVIICAYGLVLAIPFLLSLMALSLFKLSWLTLLLPLAVLAYSALFLPMGFANAWVSKRVQALRPQEARDDDLFVVQLTLRPRLCRGARAVLEDADDFGWLWFGPNGLEYRGDAVSFSLPHNPSAGFRRRSIGWRGLFVYGDRFEVTVSDVPGLTGFEVAERFSRFLPASRAISRRLHERLRHCIGNA